MKTFHVVATAALLMTSTAAYAGNSISFDIEGQKIHIEAPNGCNNLSCLQITAPGIASKSFNLNGFNLDGLKSKNADDDGDVATTTPAQGAPQASPAPHAAASVPQPPAAIATVAPPPPPPPPAPVVAAPQSAPAASAAPLPPPAPVPAPAAAAPTTPIGVWATEENKGNVRIEQCGSNLCGYAERSGEKILINMKPSDNKWVGRIHDPDGGGNYDSTIAMKGPNILRVQGCAFGGMFCGGQTWKRIS
jgi:uncharacterized protein (DUF2147 family)